MVLDCFLELIIISYYEGMKQNCTAHHAVCDALGTGGVFLFKRGLPFSESWGVRGS